MNCMRTLIPELDDDPQSAFPGTEHALDEPNGLLAFGGDLTPARLVNAYRHGIFPWFSEGEPILWWSPSPRTVFETDAIHLSRRFRRSMKKSTWQVTSDTAFAQVIQRCATISRDGQPGTWITQAMQRAYCELHRLGHAHSFEVWNNQALVGGIYGVSVGRMFFGESMFSSESGGSKIALAALALHLREWQWPLIDAQVESTHLLSMGAKLIDRDNFIAQVTELTRLHTDIGTWSEQVGIIPVQALI